MKTTLADARPGWYEGLRPRPPMTVTEYADKNRILNSKSSPEPGPWKTSRIPYMKDIMDDLSQDSPVEVVSLMKCTQVAGTEILNNWVAYTIEEAPGPTMIVQPTVNLGKRWSRQRFTPMIEEMPGLNARIKDSRSRDSGNTVESKEYDGGMVVITGANSGSALRSMPVKYLGLDEIDAYPADVDGEGDPCDLAEERTSNFARRKVVKISTPTTKDFSAIEKAYHEGDQRVLYVPCPHCEEYQTLILKNLRCKKTDAGEWLTDTAAYVCEHCGALIGEHHKPWMFDRYKWVVEGVPNDKNHSYRINKLYAPLGWTSWGKILDKYRKAKKVKERLKTFTNTTEGLPFEEATNKITSDVIKDRAEDYPLRECPRGVLLLVAGVDTQPDRFEVVVWGLGLNLHEWVIDYHVIWGSPSLATTRAQLDEYLATPFPHAAGCDLVIQATAVDSGGHNTQDIYDYCRVRKTRRIIATKGFSAKGRPIIGKPTKVDVTVHGKTIPKGAEVWMIGSDTAKSLIYARLTTSDPEHDGFVHCSSHLPDEFFKQLTSEKLKTRYVKGHPVLEWILPSGVRNEVLDCTVNAKAAAYYLGVHRWRPAQWRQLEDKVQPATSDMFATSAAIEREEQVETAAKAVRPAPKRAKRRRKSSWVNGGLNG